jgi:dienelactone hydrolase
MTLGRAVHACLPLLVLCAACAVLRPVAGPLPGSPSAIRLATAPFAVGRYEETFVDPSRPDDERDGPGARRRRTLVTTVWFPYAAPGPHPLVVYSHGYFATRLGATYLAEFLASRGYVVAAPDHPLTRRRAASRRVEDVVQQPGDLRVVIDRLLALSAGERPFDQIDPQRIGVMGLSLGGMTATLAAFHPRLRDPRIRAAVSIAGPMTLFGPRFFVGVSVPFLMLAGDEDVVIDYAANAPLALERVPTGRLVTIHGATHVGFDDSATGLLRLFPNPDVVACWWLARTLDLSHVATVPAGIIGPEIGIATPLEILPPCATSAPCTAMDPRRQHLVAALTIGAFFDAVLGADPAIRAAGEEYLRRALSVDFPELRYVEAPSGMIMSTPSASRSATMPLPGWPGSPGHR